MMSVWKAFPAVLFLLAPLAFPQKLTPQQDSHKQELFARIFGQGAVEFDAAAVEKVKRLPPGERVKLDTNHDGKIDTIYFIDDDPKHQTQFRPILVKVIDEDGDMDRDGDGDLDSDLYIADWHADGSVDGVVDYKDTDGDNGLDEMAIYAYSANSKQLGTDAIQVWWSRDVAHTHQLWDTINYRYQQPECQFRTAFGGDEIFSSYIFDSAKGRFVPSWENPFAFYDEDGDHLAEIAIRFSGTAERTTSMRYSFDADNDTDGDNVHDYDFSFSAVAASDGEITITKSLMEAPQLRGFPVDPVLSWRNARRFGESANWAKVQLAWVENDNNVDSRPGGDPHERWEGVIASGTDNFPQVGGPPVGLYNTRYEADLDNSGKMKLYYLAADRRMHLAGADSSWLKVDYNNDGQMDMEFRYLDSNHDGVIDTWEMDVDGDGRTDRTAHIANPLAQPAPSNYQSFTAFYNRTIDESLSANQKLIDELKAVLQSVENEFQIDAVESYYTNELVNYRKQEGVGLKIRNSREATRYYQDLIRERYFYRLTRALAGRPGLLDRVETAYDSGDYAQAAKLLSSEFPKVLTAGDWPAEFSKRLPVHISNAGGSARLREPIKVDLSAIRKQAADFNPRNFAVTTGTKWIAPRELPSQGDDHAIVFLADVRANEQPDYWIYYSPSGELRNSYTAQTTGSVHDSGARWESARLAYLFDNGKVEFAGKQPVLTALSEPGVKALQAADTAGLGGLTIWEEGKPYPVFASSKLKFETRIVSEGPVKTVVEAVMHGFATGQSRYDIRELFSVYAGGQYSENSLTIRRERASTPVRLSLGFTKLPNDRTFFHPEAGYFGSWGRQDDIVQEIGEAAIFADRAATLQQQANQHDLVFTVASGKAFTWYALGDWRRGRMFPVAPTAANWQNEIRALAARLHAPLNVRIGNAGQR
jgi:hypothetical protein